MPSGPTGPSPTRHPPLGLQTPRTRCPRPLCPAPCSPQGTSTGPRPLPGSCGPAARLPASPAGQDTPPIHLCCRHHAAGSRSPGHCPLASWPPLDLLWPQTEMPCILPSQARARPGRSPRWPVFPDGHGGDHHSSGHPWRSGTWMQRRTTCSPRHCSLGFEGCGALDAPRFHSHFADSAAAALVTTLTQSHGSNHSGLHLPLFTLLKGGSNDLQSPLLCTGNEFFAMCIENTFP